MKYANWLAELIKMTPCRPCFPTPGCRGADRGQGGLFRVRPGAAGRATGIPTSLHATPQRHHIGTFRRLLRDELMQVADQAAQDDVEKGYQTSSALQFGVSRGRSEVLLSGYGRGHLSEVVSEFETRDSLVDVHTGREGLRRGDRDTEETQIEGRVPDAPQTPDAGRTRRTKKNKRPTRGASDSP